MKVFYFSATGNSLYVAKQLGGKPAPIPQMLKTGQFSCSDDAIGLVFPCYSFGVPRLVLDFLSQAQWQAEYLFAVATYGKLAGTVLHSLEQAAEQNGIFFDYLNTLLMTDNYLPNFKMEKQALLLPQKNVEERLHQIKSDIGERRVLKPKVTAVQKLFSSTVSSAFKSVFTENAAKKYIVKNNCNGCGLCAQICPTGNITVSADKKPPVSFDSRCQNCLGCVHACPQNALHLKNEKSSARFLNGGVTIKELLSANSQL